MPLLGHARPSLKLDPGARAWSPGKKKVWRLLELKNLCAKYGMSFVFKKQRRELGSGENTLPHFVLLFALSRVSTAGFGSSQVRILSLSPLSHESPGPVRGQ